MRGERRQRGQGEALPLNRRGSARLQELLGVEGICVSGCALAVFQEKREELPGS